MVLIGSIAVAVLMLGVASGGNPTSAEAADCQAGSYWANPTGNVGFNAGAGQIVTSVCIQTSATTNTGQIGNGLAANGCYTVSGVGTSAASVTRENTTSACQAVNIYASYAATGSTTAAPVPTIAAPGSQFATSGQANGMIVSGRIPPFDADGGMVVFGGGTIDQLVAATGCSSSLLALWTTVGGNFVIYIPGTSNTAVNAAFMAQYPGNQISGNTPFMGRCN
ncbi:MAG: hypothetical protein DWI48_04955 [Chloroflexi bacterium]|nr:MAG: hypothetical protein DWI48_04955 [Chloroflexota bacterium]